MDIFFWYFLPQVTCDLGSSSEKDLADEIIEYLGDWQDVSFESDAKKAVQFDADEETDDDERNMFMNVYSSKNLEKSKGDNLFKRDKYKSWICKFYS